MAWDHFPQAAARLTQLVRSRQSADHRLWGERFGLSSALRPRAVSGAPSRPKMPSPGVTLPGPFVTPPSPVIPVATRWLRTPAGVAEFEQGVLYGCGPAQVGFGG
jgi:hypothetical protein